MRIQLASDLHLEFLARQFPDERLIAPAYGADVLVLAGDISVGSAAVELFKDWPVPVLYVAGNHEGCRLIQVMIVARLLFVPHPSMRIHRDRVSRDRLTDMPDIELSSSWGRQILPGTTITNA
ncbi:hypothetical protein KNO81_31350 [Paraburkholderia sediminicola]|nr:hypothetical protein [Paraburkholderia sediminicola]